MVVLDFERLIKRIRFAICFAAESLAEIVIKFAARSTSTTLLGCNRFLDVRIGEKFTLRSIVTVTDSESLVRYASLFCDSAEAEEPTAQVSNKC